MGSVRLLLPVLVVSLCGCGLASPSTGEAVAPGVARASFERRANGTDLVRIKVYFPADPSGVPRPGPLPGVVFIQGGFVGTERYAWQAITLAQAGYVVAMPENALELAFFTIDYGQTARALLASPPKGSLLEGLVDERRIAVAGHSLGSVVALKLALEGNFAAVLLEAGFPDSADLGKLPAFKKPSLSLAGELDCSAKLDDVRAGWNSMPSPTALAVISGVTHYQFTDSDAEDVKKKCTAGVTIAGAHAAIRAAMVGFLDSALTDQQVGEPALRAVPGLTVEVR